MLPALVGCPPLRGADGLASFGAGIGTGIGAGAGLFFRLDFTTCFLVFLGEVAFCSVGLLCGLKGSIDGALIAFSGRGVEAVGIGVHLVPLPVINCDRTWFTGVLGRLGRCRGVD